MLAKETIIPEFPYLTPLDDGNKALDIMENFLLGHIVVVEDGKFMGIVSMDDIYNFDLFTTKVRSFKHPLIRAYALENQHIFSVLKTMTLFNTSVLAVVDKEENYIGTLTRDSLLKSFASILCIKEDGYHLFFTKNTIDFTATEICNLIEKNDAKILSLYVNESKSASGLDIYVKIQTADLEAVMQSFERYDYDVTLLNSEQNEYDDFYKERLDNLLNYLNI
jgi:signal-transduction protein with cAMP-binding, CBS, and nucleotidyltransferase domain